MSVAIAAVAISAAVSAYGAYSSAEAQKNAAQQQGAAAESQGRISSIQAAAQGDTAAVLAGYQAQTDAVITRIRGELAAQQIAINTQEQVFALGVAAAEADARARSADMAREAAAFSAWSAERTAQDSLDAGERAGVAQSLQAAQIQGRQVAGQAAAGVDLGVGSAAEVRASTAILAEMDFNQIGANAAREAWGHRVDKAGFLVQEAVAKGEGEVSRLRASGAREAATLTQQQGGQLAGLARQIGGQAAGIAESNGATAAWLARATGGNNAEFLKASGLAQATGYYNQAASISPWGAAGISLIGSAANAAARWYAPKYSGGA